MWHNSKCFAKVRGNISPEFLSGWQAGYLISSTSDTLTYSTLGLFTVPPFLYVTVYCDSCLFFWKEEQVDRYFPRKYLDILIIHLFECIVMPIKLTILLEVPKHQRVTCLPIPDRKERCLLLSVYFKSSEVNNHPVFCHWLLTRNNQAWLIENCHK